MYSSSLIHVQSSCIETTPSRCTQLSSRTTSKLTTLQKSSLFRGGKARCELVIQMAATKEKKNADLVRLTELLNAEEQEEIIMQQQKELLEMMAEKLKSYTSLICNSSEF